MEIIIIFCGFFHAMFHSVSESPRVCMRIVYFLLGLNWSKNLEPLHTPHQPTDQKGPKFHMVCDEQMSAVRWSLNIKPINNIFIHLKLLKITFFIAILFYPLRIVRNEKLSSFSFGFCLFVVVVFL